MDTRLKTLFWLTDVGFIVYWTVTALQLIPPAFMFNDYGNPVQVAWNWSFLPLDLAISATGLASVYFAQRKRAVWRNVALISLVLTFCSGLQAITFWSIQCDFNVWWWLPNLYLLVYPLWFIPRITSETMPTIAA